MRKNNNFYLFFIFPALLLSAFPVFAFSSSGLHDYRVILHAHSQISGEDEYSLEDYAQFAKEKDVDVLLLTEYFQQKVTVRLVPPIPFLQWSHEKPSAVKYGVSRYFQATDEFNQTYPEVLAIPGAEVTPYYWWSGSLWSQDWTVHDLQKNILVAGLDAPSLQNLPTIENGNLTRNLGPKREGAKPYQVLIDYVQAHQGITIWSTPDEVFGSNFKIGPIYFKTPAYSQALLDTENYTGVGIFPDGTVETGRVGGIWDQLLYKYCRKRRSQPVWAFAEGVIHKKTFQENFGKWDNFVRATARTPEAILDSIKRGSFYIRKIKHTDLRLNDFFISDSASEKKSGMGETLICTGQPRIFVEIGLVTEKKSGDEVNVQVIRNGQVVYEDALSKTKPSFGWEDPNAFEDGPLIYYRVQGEVRTGGRVMSNPVFVEKV
ncbi:MAG: hypothetical protein EXS63_00625 [Candidatus Omnitrophica bacterium]|nr:hypothetical protein [Candidatus Omnitrophota bacterium]